MSNINLTSAAEPFADFDGVSDFSDIVTNIVNTLAAVVRNRLESFVNGGDEYFLDDKIQIIVNKVLNLVSFPISLGDNLLLDGFLYDDIVTTYNTMKIPLKTAIRSEASTFDSTGCNTNMFSEYGEKNFDL